jgi:hypothetical protein
MRSEGRFLAAKPAGEEPVTAADVLEWYGCTINGPWLYCQAWQVPLATMLGVTLHGAPQVSDESSARKCLTTGLRLPVTARQVFNFVTSAARTCLPAVDDEPSPGLSVFDDVATDLGDPFPPDDAPLPEVEAPPAQPVPATPALSPFQRRLVELQTQARGHSAPDAAIPERFKREFFPSVTIEPGTRKDVP